MSGPAIALEELEAFIASRAAGSRFPPSIEARFEADTAEKRTWALRRGTLRTIVVYNCFLLGDALLVPDRFALSLALHLGVVTPWLALVALMLRPGISPVLRELLVASSALAMMLQVLGVYLVSSSPHAGHYQNFVLLVFLYSNVVLRPRMAFAIGATLATLALHALALALGPPMPMPVMIAVLLQSAGCALLSLAALRHVDRDLRRAYLTRLRESLRNAAAQADASHDELTGLANRRGLEQRAAEIWTRPDRVATVILIDIDHFKPFNDRYGHLAGDNCLRQVAGLLRQLCPAEGLAVRYGGEELLVLLHDVDLFSALRLAERMRRAIETLALTHEGNPGRGVVTASFGVAAGFPRDLTLQAVIAAADTALYAAKRSGRNQIWPPFSTPLREDGAGNEGKVVRLTTAARNAPNTPA